MAPSWVITLPKTRQQKRRETLKQRWAKEIAFAVEKRFALPTDPNLTPNPSAYAPIDIFSVVRFIKEYGS